MGTAELFDAEIDAQVAEVVVLHEDDPTFVYGDIDGEMAGLHRALLRAGRAFEGETRAAFDAFALWVKETSETLEWIGRAGGYTYYHPPGTKPFAPQADHALRKLDGMLSETFDVLVRSIAEFRSRCWLALPFPVRVAHIRRLMDLLASARVFDGSVDTIDRFNANLARQRLPPRLATRLRQDPESFAEANVTEEMFTPSVVELERGIHRFRLLA